jgi:hypothetical protein
LYVALGGELGQPVLLELARAMPSDVQGPDDLVDRPRLSVCGEAVSKREHGSLLLGKLNKRLAQRFSFEALLNLFLRPGLLRPHQFPERGLFISDRLVQARNGTSCLLDLDDLFAGEAGCQGDLLWRRLTVKPLAELTFGETDRKTLARGVTCTARESLQKVAPGAR